LQIENDFFWFMHKRFVAIVVAVIEVLMAPAQSSLLSIEGDTIAYPTKTNSFLSEKEKKPSLALTVGNLLLANGTIHLIDRFGVNEDCYKVTLHSIHRNFKSGFVWDNNLFFINHLGHPYMGALNFNAARNSGFSFAQSIPSALAGAFIWEFFGETESPSINDMITTTIAGTMFGESSYRLANHVLDDSDKGARRVIREATAAFLNPLQALQRLLDGRMWKVRRKDPLSSQEPDEESNSVLSLSDRYVVASEGMSHGSHHPFVSFTTEYGETVDGETHTSPYDFISIDAALAFGGGQPIIPRFNVMTRLCSTPVFTERKTSGELGLYQFFMYEDSRLGDSLRGPFPFGETASLGPGLIMKSRRLSSRLAVEQRLFARGVILGSAESDYYNCIDRHYNMGSGFGASSTTRLSWNNTVSLQFDAYYLHLYTWRGYESEDITNMTSECLNTLGDRSHARLLKLDLQLQAPLVDHCGIAFGATWFTRHTHYKFYPESHKGSYELRAGLSWSF